MKEAVSAVARDYDFVVIDMLSSLGILSALIYQIYIRAGVVVANKVCIFDYTGKPAVSEGPPGVYQGVFERGR